MSAAPPADPHRYEQAVAAWRQRVPVAAETFARMESEARELAFTVANVTNADVLQDVWEAIDRAIAMGTTFDDFKADVGAKLTEEWGGEDLPALETIFRTNMATAYSAGRHDVLTTPAAKEAFPNWRFDAIEDGRIDDDCAAADGTVLPQDDAWWSTHHPPLHPNCRCVVTPLSEKDAEDAGGADEEGPDVDAADGFGARPSTTGADWDPDLSRFAPPLRAVLADSIKG